MDSWHVEVLKRWRNKLRLIRYEMLGLIESKAPLDPAETTASIEHVENYLDAQIQGQEPGKAEPNAAEPRGQ